MKKYRYIIHASPWDENIGGLIVLHTLCHLLNEIGEKAFLYPQSTHSFYTKNKFRMFFKRIINFKKCLKAVVEMETNPLLNTPKINLFKEFFIFDTSNIIVCYPEVIYANPLVLTKIVRYLLHNPGNFKDGVYKYGPNELYFRYSNSFAQNFKPEEGGFVSSHFMTIATTPNCYHRMGGCDEERKGTAYCIRKGKGKQIIHDLKDSILIDGKSHNEIADIFRRVKAFYSYDSVTAYSHYALLCGCPSYVILGKDEKPEDFRPSEQSRKYIRFGLDDTKDIDMDEAYTYYDNMRKQQEKNNRNLAITFVTECETFFSTNNISNQMPSEKVGH